MDTEGKRYEFDSFVLDAKEGMLWRDGEPVPLTPKAFDTLRLLVERHKHVVSKDELLRQVWAESFVEENNLSQNISLLRKTIGAHFIETIPKRGYRFTAQVREAAATGDLRGAPAHIRRFAATTPHVETHYARSNDVNIAYQVLGDAPLDIVFVMGWVSHLEYFWAEPSFAKFLRRLASFSRLILFDKRGTGLSDRVPLNALPTLEQRMDDVRAVMEAVGSKRAVLCGVSEGGPMCSLFAATYPEKTSALVMIGTYAKRICDKDYPWGPTAEQRAEFYEIIKRDWGTAVGIEDRAPSRAADPRFREWWATYLRMGASPGAALALTKMNADIDVRHVLGSIRVPTLVIHRSEDACLKIEEGRYVASQIPGAKFVELPGADHLPFVGDQDAILDEIEMFLTGVRNAPETDSVLATVLVSRRAAHENLARHDEHARRTLELFRGRELRSAYPEVSPTANTSPLVATFTGPARAIRAACAMNDAAHRLGIEARTGVHTGECDAGREAGGVAVQIAAQIASRAGAGEVIVSRTVKDLVAGSGITFTAHSLHTLEGVAGDWQLHEVERGSCG